MIKDIPEVKVKVEDMTRVVKVVQGRVAKAIKTRVAKVLQAKRSPSQQPKMIQFWTEISWTQHMIPIAVTLDL